MKTKEDTYSVAVLICRLQVHQLTEAHKELIQDALDRHPKVLLYLGLSPLRHSTSNPLDYNARRAMVLESFPPSKYPNLSVGYINDQPNDEVWSRNLDKLISDHLSPSDTVICIGGRESFIPHYRGKHGTREMVSSSYVSGTEIRRQLAQAPQNDPLFRAGAIWASLNRYPSVLPTVDIAVFRSKERQLLLARKLDEDKYRFVGGFTSPNDNSYEEAAMRELDEETGLTVGLGALHYVGSKKIDDWRFRSCQDRIVSHLFLGHYTMGMARANDDIASVKWHDIDKVNEYTFVDEHIPLWEMLKAYAAEHKIW